MDVFNCVYVCVQEFVLAELVNMGYMHNLLKQENLGIRGTSRYKPVKSFAGYKKIKGKEWK